MRAQLKDFYGNYTSEAETAEVIRTLYEKTCYVMIHIQRLLPVYMENTKKIPAM